jgi:hypothetical protein
MSGLREAKNARQLGDSGIEDNQHPHREIFHFSTRAGGRRVREGEGGRGREREGEIGWEIGWEGGREGGRRMR